LPFQDHATHVQLYFGYQHALWEITQELAKIFAHKKTIAVVAGREPAFDDVAAAFSAQEYTVRYLTAEEVQAPEKWLPSVEKDLLFVLSSEDDFVTGQIYDLAPLDRALKDKRVFRVVVSHSAFHLRPEAKPGLYDVRVLSLSRERALMIGGERARVTPHVAPKLPWSGDDPAAITRLLHVQDSKETEKKKAAVQSFEALLPQGFQALFKKDEARTFDRAAIFSAEFDGSAVVDELTHLLGTGAAKPGFDEPFDTTSPCRWQSPKFADWLSRRELSPAQIRGLVILTADELSPGLGKKLEQAAEKIRLLQNGK
jgi:hypothetical protein